MKRMAILFVLFLGLSAIPVLPATSKPKAGADTATVYITKTGKKYHRANCQYLVKSKTAISLEAAKQQGYTPCSRCYGKKTEAPRK